MRFHEAKSFTDMSLACLNTKDSKNAEAVLRSGSPADLQRTVIEMGPKPRGGGLHPGYSTVSGTALGTQGETPYCFGKQCTQASTVRGSTRYLTWWLPCLDWICGKAGSHQVPRATLHSTAGLQYSLLNSNQISDPGASPHTTSPHHEKNQFMRQKRNGEDCMVNELNSSPQRSTSYAPDKHSFMWRSP